MVSKIFLIIPARSKPLGNQVADKGKSIIIEIFELINEQRLLELKYHFFVILNEIMDIDNDLHCWKMLQKE